MRDENRIDFPIPDDTLVKSGFHAPLFGFEASPGDMIVENINNASGAHYIDCGFINPVPGLPFAGQRFKRYKAIGVETKEEYVITITDEGIMTETGNPIKGDVQRVVAYYRDFNIRHRDISDFLRRFLI